MNAATLLPAGVRVFERGWLSANNILLLDADSATLVDSGYFSHRAQTLDLVRNALGDRPLDCLINTHLHSDHCGGNAALQAAYPAVKTFIPPGEAAQVARWDTEALTYLPTGQICERFAFTGTLQPGTTVAACGRQWEIHAAPGHDPHSIVLFEPISRCLISADALWESGFGVVFPELEGIDAFTDVGRTLDLIESLRPALIIPGHGRMFSDVDSALSIARQRLEHFVAAPEKHATHAAKVLIKFKLLEWQRVERDELLAWELCTPYLLLLHSHYFSREPIKDWLERLLDGLVTSRVASLDGSLVLNA